jgi:aminoglycoside phosphotransferase (APT) family kinase protein
METVVTDIVEEVCPGAIVTALSPTRTGNFKQTVVVKLADAESIVVQYRSLDHGALRPEAQVTEVIGVETPVPVPEIHGVGAVGDHAYIVTRRVEGVNLHERFEALPPDRRLDLTRTLGEYLAVLHDRFRFEEYGSVVADNGGLRASGEATEWTDWVRSYLAEGLAEFPSPLSDLVEPVRETIEGNLDALPAQPSPRLYPWDYRPGNVLLADEEATESVAAVLDWADPLAAHRELSLAKAEFLTADWYADPGLADRLREAFYDGYREHLPVPDAYWDERRRLYRLIGLVRSAVDSGGDITRPRYPMVDEQTALAFHRRHIGTLLTEEPSVGYG